MNDDNLINMVFLKMEGREFSLASHHNERWTAICSKNETEVLLHSTEKNSALTVYRHHSEDKVGKSTIWLLPNEKEETIEDD